MPVPQCLISTDLFAAAAKILSGQARAMLSRSRLLPVPLAAVAAMSLISTASATVSTYTYDPSLGTLPTSQGWSEAADPSATVNLAGGILGLQSTTGGLQNWSLSTVSFAYSDTVTINARLRINASNHYEGAVRRAGYYLAINDNTGLPAWTAITDSGVFFHFDGENYSSFATIALADSNFHDFKMVANASGYKLSIDGNLILNEPSRAWASSGTSWIGFGDFSNAGISNVDLSSYRATVGAVPEPSAMILFTAGLLGLYAKRRQATKAGESSPPALR